MDNKRIRTVSDVNKEELAVNRQLDDLYSRKRKFEIYENEMTAHNNNALMHLRQILDYYVTNSSEQLAYEDMLMIAETSNKKMHASFELKREKFQAEERKLNTRLDKLYYERQRINFKEEETKLKEKRKGN